MQDCGHHRYISFGLLYENKQHNLNTKKKTVKNISRRNQNQNRNALLANLRLVLDYFMKISNIILTYIGKS